MKSRKIKLDHIKKNKEGNVDFHTIDMPHTQDYSRICYFNWRVTVNMLTDEIRILRSDHKRAIVRMPHILSKHFQDWIFSLEDRTFM